MGATFDVIVFGVAAADTVNSLEDGADPVGYAGSVISTAANAAQLIAGVTQVLGRTAPSITKLTTITRAIAGGSAIGVGLTAVQMKMDFESGRDIKIGDYVAVGVGFPIGIAVAVGAISAGSMLIPFGAIVGLAATVANIYGFTLTDVFSKIREFTSNES